MNVGERIKKIRLARGLTLDDVSKRMGYSNRSAFYKIETEDNGVTVEKLKNIAEILEVSLDDLLYDECENIDVKETLEIIEKNSLVDDILYATYHIHKETYYDMAIISSSWDPIKIFGDDDIINLLKKGSFDSSYEVYHNDLKIVYIKCSPGAFSVMDSILYLANANIENIFYLGDGSSLNKELEVSSIVSPSQCFSFDGTTPFLKEKIDKKAYGNAIIPFNMDKIDKMIELAKENNIIIHKAKVFCASSIVLQYSHIDEILATGAELIEKETAAFYSALKAINKNGMALIIITNNYYDDKNLVEKIIDDKNKSHQVRSNILKELLSLFVENKM